MDRQILKALMAWDTRFPLPASRWGFVLIPDTLYTPIWGTILSDACAEVSVDRFRRTLWSWEVITIYYPAEFGKGTLLVTRLLTIVCCDTLYTPFGGLFRSAPGQTA